MVDLMDARRQLYETYQPTFWRPSPDANSRQTKYFAMLVSKKDAIVLICEDAGAFCGFIIASLIEAPPVYDPGGKVTRHPAGCTHVRLPSGSGLDSRLRREQDRGHARAAGAIF